MSTLADVQYAMNGETGNTKEPADYVPADVAKAHNNGFVVFKLVKKNNGGVHLPCIDYAIDPRTVSKEKPEGDGPELIRVVEGVSTIWAKEQEKLPKEFLSKKVRTLSWPKGSRFASIAKIDKAMLAFLKVCNSNVKNKLRIKATKFEFFEYNPNEEAKERYAKKRLELEMINKANNVPYEDMKKHAFYLGISLVNDIGGVKEEETLRYDYMMEAQRDPKRFQESLASKLVDIKFRIRKAMLEGKIDTGREKGKAYWGKGGGLICSMPTNEKPLDFLTSLANTPNDEGKDFLLKLNQIET